MTAQMTYKMSTAYSGLSALIQAATSQLGHLIDSDRDQVDDHVSDQSHLTSPTLEGGYASTASSDLDLRDASSPKQSETPSIVPEQAPTCTTTHSFPEELMTLLIDPGNEDVITFLPDGKYFAIRRKEFTENLLHGHFRINTFEEFLELIRGWGFARINCNETVEDGNRNLHNSHNDSKGDNHYIHGNDNTATTASTNNSARAAIHVFRHPHFKKDQPIDTHKIKFGTKGRDKSYAHQRASDAAASILSMSLESAARVVPQGSSTPRVIESSMSDDSPSSFLNSKRRLSPSHLERNSADRHDPKGQRVVVGDQYQRSSSSNSTEHHVAPPIFTGISSSNDSSDLPPPVARRRSSIELRGKAMAITTSKLNLQSGEGPAEDDDDDNSDGCDETPKANRTNGGTATAASATSSSYTSAIHNIQRTPRKHERKLSTASLVDGAVEAATHTIVTDAIETLLFDESHTRETYLKHEKELSVSSLPGVVPISKQLFACKNPIDTLATASAAHGEACHQSKAKNNTNSKPKATTNTGSKKKDTKNTHKKPVATSSSSDVIASSCLDQASTDGASTPRVVTIGEPRSVASPARLEAAAALVEQSQMVDDVTRSAASRSELLGHIRDHQKE